jgi:hypothetical protein
VTNPGLVSKSQREIPTDVPAAPYKPATGASCPPTAGFQWWGKLPSSLKMTAPRYQEVKAIDAPEVRDDDGMRKTNVNPEFWV